MLHAGKVLAAAAADLFDDPSLIDAAKKELRERLDGASYRCAIPDEVVPKAIQPSGR